MKVKLNALKAKSTRQLNKATKALKKASPEITFIVGAGLVILGMYEVAKASMKVEGEMAPVKDEIDAIKQMHENPESALPDGGVYTDAEYRKDITQAYFKSGLTMAKLYLPAVLTITFALISLGTSNKILRKRNAALTAAYATLEKSYTKYRERVKERFGSDLDKELRYGIKNVQVEEKIVDEKGKEKVVKKDIPVVDSELEGYSDYAVIFDNRSSEYVDDMEYLKTLVLGVQKVCNQQLKARGHLFLNEIRTQLGFEETKAGQIVGFVYDENNAVGDNEIEIYMHEAYRETPSGAYEKILILDFNVDGRIIDILN